MSKQASERASKQLLIRWRAQLIETFSSSHRIHPSIHPSIRWCARERTARWILAPSIQILETGEKGSEWASRAVGRSVFTKITHHHHYHHNQHHHRFFFFFSYPFLLHLSKSSLQFSRRRCYTNIHFNHSPHLLESLVFGLPGWLLCQSCLPALLSRSLVLLGSSVYKYTSHLAEIEATQLAG